MAHETVCQTPGTQYHIRVSSRRIAVQIDLPIDLNLGDGQAELLEANLHNAIELVLAPYFAGKAKQ